MGVPAKVLIMSLAGCAAILVAGCGTSSGGATRSNSGAKEPGSAALVASMQSSVRRANSVHVDGQLTNNGMLVGVDLSLIRNGDIVGSVSQDNAAFQVIGVSGKVYVRATPAFLRQIKAPASACAVVCGKWIQLTSQAAARLIGDLSMTTMTGLLTSSQVPELAESGSTTVNGQSAYVLRAADGSAIDVSAADQHYPLRASTAGSPREEVRYTQWNSVPHPTQPPPGQVLNLSGGS